MRPTKRLLILKANKIFSFKQMISEKKIFIFVCLALRGGRGPRKFFLSKCNSCTEEFTHVCTKFLNVRRDLVIQEMEPWGCYL